MTAQVGTGPLFWVLVCAAAVGQGSLHLVLPALGAIAETYGVSFGTAQLTLSLTMVSMAISTLVTGPLSDIFGRRPVFLAGLVLLALGSAGAALAPTIEFLIAARMCQGIGGVTGLILGRAIMRDLYEGPTAAKGVAYLMIGQIAGPASAPILGALVLLAGPWPLLFWLYFAFALGLLAAGFVHVQETRPVGKNGQGRFLQNAGRLLTKTRFWSAAIAGAFTMTIFFSLISIGSWAVSEKYDLSPAWYAVLMLTFSAHFVIGNFISGKVVARFGPDHLIQRGAIGMTAAVGLLTCLIVVEPSPAWFLVGCAAFAFSNGFVMPNSVAIGIGVEPLAAGTASGLIVAAQLALSAVVTQLVVGSLEPFGLSAIIWVFLPAMGGVWVCVWGLSQTGEGVAHGIRS